MLQKIKKLLGLESKVNKILPRYYFDNRANLSKSEIRDLTFHIRHYEENLPAIESRGINLEEFATIDYLLLNQMIGLLKNSIYPWKIDVLKCAKSISY